METGRKHGLSNRRISESKDRVTHLLPVPFRIRHHCETSSLHWSLQLSEVVGVSSCQASGSQLTSQQERAFTAIDCATTDTQSLHEDVRHNNF